MLSFVLAAALASIASPAGPSPTAIRVMRSTSGRHRYVRTESEIRFAGVVGKEESIDDLATGRYVDRISAGVLSSSSGFDGRRFWSADATGMPAVEQNAVQRLDAFAWAHLFGRRGPEQPRMLRLHGRRGSLQLRLRFPALPWPLDVTLDRATGHVLAVDEVRSGDRTVVRYGDYRRFSDIVLPFRSETAGRYRVVRERVLTVALPAAVPDVTFAPPDPPDDVRLDGVTTIPLVLEDLQPIVPVRINGGPLLRVMFDSGSTNYLKPAAARRLHLTLVGKAKSGGVGAGLVDERYTNVARLRIGAAELRDQPFSVVDDRGMQSDVDGVIGCEVLQRFAVRFDFARGVVDLTRDPERFSIGTPPIPLRLTSCTPEIDGALDGLRGPFSIDTGSGTALDVLAPFVRAHDLIARYHAAKLHVDGDGIGGAIMARTARARSLRLGNAERTNLPISLSTMTAGAFADATQIGNVGIPVLMHYVLVFDYRTSRMWLLPR